MLRNYVKIAWRNLLKNRTYSIINVAGLSFSVAFCLLLFFHIRYEQSFDTFHQKKDRLFRLEMTNLWNVGDTSSEKKHLFSFLTKNDDVDNATLFPLIVGPDMQNTFPEVKSITRLQNLSDHFGDQLVKVNNQVYKESRVVYADNNFFSNFSFHLKQGDLKKVLSYPNNIVLSENVAKKYFGRENAIGKTLSLVSDSNKLYTVSGIAAEVPDNSSIQFDFVIPLISDPGYARNITEKFNQSNHVFIVELADGVSVEKFQAKLNVWVKTYFADYVKDFKDANINNFHWYLRPLASCHYSVAHDWGHYTNAKNIYQLASLVIVILLIASLNYILLAISNAAARSQEIGIRKVMGAKRRSIILQFWVETQIIVIIAVIAGLLLSQLFIPLYNSAINTQLNFSNISWKEVLLASVALSFLLGIIAGYYPALLISKMKPASIIKTFQTFKINPRFSKVLVVLQYTACVVFMISAFVIRKQMQYITNKDLGFDKEQILIVRNPTWDNKFTKRTHDALNDFAKTQPYISYFSGMNGGLDGSGNTNGFMLNGVQQWRKELTVDYDYFEMLGLKFVQGRPFSIKISSDTSKIRKVVVVNETLFNMLGKTAKVDQFCEPINATIIGVVKDYHFASLSEKIQPEEHRLANGFEMSFLFKIKAGQMQPAISKIENEWKTITHNYPFEYTFLDQTIAKMYEPDDRWQKTIQASCFFAILIACMGLFGLSAINAINRTKEIGIRKVLGASVKDIVTTLSSSFLIMVIISIVIATPFAWWLMNKWLEDFAYRINISWWMFLVVGITAVIIALGTISFQAIRAALANPVKNLRTE
ncbi:MAG TPA: ABC transporter permease [Puia sp.]|nr:ABC transporter permease [Puia sp.]